MGQERSILQKIAEGSGGLVTPANCIDAIAFAGVIKYAPELDRLQGIVMVGASYAADMVDGIVARSTGTTSKIGEAFDAAGDKIKTAYTAAHIARLDLAPRTLLAAVALQNIANTGAVIYDRLHNRTPQITVSKPGKRSTFSNTLGLSLHSIGAEIERNGDQVSADRMRNVGTAITVGGLIAFGIPATRQYWKAATSVS